jgi:hypothetical protein
MAATSLSIHSHATRAFAAKPA